MNTDAIIAAILSGVAVSLLLPQIKEEVTPVCREAFSWQEKTVQVAEALGSSAAPAARAELEAARPVFEARVQSFEAVPSE